MEVDVGLAAEAGTQAPKLAWRNALLLGELALSARAFGAEEARRELRFVSRIVQGSREDVALLHSHPFLNQGMGLFSATMGYCIAAQDEKIPTWSPMIIPNTVE
jgi:hypothetical protein